MPISSEFETSLIANTKGLGKVLIGLLSDVMVPKGADGLEADFYFKTFVKEIFPPEQGLQPREIIEIHAVGLGTWLINNNPEYAKHSSNPLEFFGTVERALNTINRRGGYNNVEKIFSELHNHPDALEVIDFMEEVVQEVRLRRARQAGIRKNK